MAYDKIEQNLIVGVSTGGDNTNSGCFAYESTNAGIDRTDQDAAHVDFSDGSASGVTATTQTGDSYLNRRRVVVSGYTVTDDDIGNTILLDSDSGASVFEGLHRISSVDTTGNYWNFNRDIRDNSSDAGTETVTGKMGGRFADPFFYRSKMHVWYNIGYVFNVYIKSGTYTAAAGNALDSTAITYMPYAERWVGYTTTRGDHYLGGARPIIDIPSSLDYAGTVFDMPDQWASSVTFLELHCGGKASKGIKLNGGFSTAYSCVVKDCDDGSGPAPYNTAYYGRGSVIACHAENCQYGYFYYIACHQCSAENCDIGFSLSYHGDQANYCLANNCTSWGFKISGDGMNPVGCVAYDCDSVGIQLNNRGPAYGCGAHSCGKGFYAIYAPQLVDCWAYNNTTNFDESVNDYQFVHTQTLTADPFESSTDFRLNDAEAGGALLAGKGIGFGGGTQTSYDDINAFVTEPAGSGSTTVVTPGPVQIGM